MIAAWHWVHLSVIYSGMSFTVDTGHLVSTYLPSVIAIMIAFEGTAIAMPRHTINERPLK